MMGERPSNMVVTSKLAELAAFAEDTPQIVKDVLSEIWSNPVLRCKGVPRKATDWLALKNGLVEALNDPTDSTKQPTIVTSVGGYDGDPPDAAGFNIVAALELCKLLRRYGFVTKVIITSAIKYADECNGMDLERLTTNWVETLQRYDKIVGNFYREVSDDISYESLWPRWLESLPASLWEAASSINNKSLIETARNKNPEISESQFINYMLSHIQAFRNWQNNSNPTSKFIIKVGAPSELRFTEWADETMEESGLEDGTPSFFASLYYPRSSKENTPPYYPTHDEVARNMKIGYTLAQLCITTDEWEGTL